MAGCSTTTFPIARRPTATSITDSFGRQLLFAYNAAFIVIGLATPTPTATAIPGYEVYLPLVARRSP
jgi:hypothetical protein